MEVMINVISKMFLKSPRDFGFVFGVILILALCASYDDAGVVLRNFKTRRMMMEELAAQRNEAKSELKSVASISKSPVNSTAEANSVIVKVATCDKYNHTSPSHSKKSKTNLKKKNIARSSNFHQANKSKKREPRAKQVFDAAILEVLNRKPAETLEVKKSETGNISFSTSELNKTESSMNKSVENFSTNQSSLENVNASIENGTTNKLESNRTNLGKNETLKDLISENKDIVKKQLTEESNFYNQTANLTTSEEDSSIADLKTSNQNEFVETNKSQDIINEKNLDFDNLTGMILPVNVQEIVEGEEVANLSSVENIVGVNHGVSKTTQLTDKYIDENVKDIEKPVKPKTPAKRKKSPNKRRKNSPKKSKDTKFKGFGMSLSENISGDGIIHLEPEPDKNEGLVNSETKTKNSSTLNEAKQIGIADQDSNQTLTNDSLLDFESVVSSGIDFLMNTEVAKNAAMAMEVFNLSDPSLTDHVIEDSDLHSFIDIIMPSSQDNEPLAVAGGTDIINVNSETAKHSNLSSNATGSANDSRIAQIHIKPFMSSDTIGLNITVNVTGLSTGKECPPPGLCLLWFVAHDHCNDDSDCSVEMKCCKVRCTMECIKV